MPPRPAVIIPAIAALLWFFVPQAVASPGWDSMQRPAPTITTLPCPLLSPAEILFRPAHPERGGFSAQRAIGGRIDPVSTAEDRAGGISFGKAILLNAVAPGAGHLYSGYNRGYLYLGVEAVAWISYFVLREDGKRRADQAKSFAGDPFGASSHWSFDRYAEAGFCNEPQGSAADSTLRSAWSNDREMFYDLIEGDASYGCGWLDSEAWSEFGNMRSNSDDFLRWAKYAGAAVMLNHAIAVIDMVRLTRGFDMPGGTNLKIKIKPTLPYPTGTIRIKKVF